MGLLDARAGDRRRHIRTTFITSLTATLAFALLPAAGAQAQAVDIRQELGVATGRERPVVGFYGMRDDVKRDQMASFLSRLSGAVAQL